MQKRYIGLVNKYYVLKCAKDMIPQISNQMGGDVDMSHEEIGLMEEAGSIHIKQIAGVVDADEV